MHPTLTNVPHNLNPCVGWLRMHLANGTTPSVSQMEVMVSKMYAAMEAVEEFTSESTS